MSDYVDAFYQSLGKLVQKKREEKGFTQEIVANALGINRATLANLEGGTHQMLTHRFFELCLILELTPESLFSSYKAVKAEQQVLSTPDEVKDIISKIRNSTQGGTNEA